MGTDVHIVVVGGSEAMLDRARTRIDELEQRWSRFIPDSELCRLNAAPGRPVIVNRETFTLISRAVDGWRRTRGAFDPSILAALETAGYDRDFARVEPVDDSSVAAGAPAPGCDAIALDSIVSAVNLPRGVSLDLGGIGKGFTADLVAAELHAGGAAGACVNMGGDLRVVGDAPTDAGWGVGLDDYGDAAPGVLVLGTGAVATTTTARRHWRRDGHELHHIIDPRTGEPAHSGLRTVTVVTGEAWHAEILTKAAFVSGVDEGSRLIAELGATGLLLADDGVVHRLPGIDAFLR